MVSSSGGVGAEGCGSDGAAALSAGGAAAGAAGGAAAGAAAGAAEGAAAGTGFVSTGGGGRGVLVMSSLGGASQAWLAAGGGEATTALPAFLVFLISDGLGAAFFLAAAGLAFSFLAASAAGLRITAIVEAKHRTADKRTDRVRVDVMGGPIQCESHPRVKRLRGPWESSCSSPPSDREGKRRWSGQQRDQRTGCVEAEAGKRDRSNDWRGQGRTHQVHDVGCRRRRA